MERGDAALTTVSLDALWPNVAIVYRIIACPEQLLFDVECQSTAGRGWYIGS